MAKFLRSTLAALVAVMGITLAACGGDGPTAPPAPPIITISGPSSVAEGEFACYKVTVAGDANPTVHFSINPAANMTTPSKVEACFGSLRERNSPYKITVTSGGNSAEKMLEVKPRQ